MSAYSITLTPRNTLPRTIVASSQLTVALRWLVWAERTASAIVSELPMRTAVLNNPHEMAIDLLAWANAS